MYCSSNTLIFKIRLLKSRKLVAKDLKAVYTAQTEENAQLALTEFDDIWGKKYPHKLNLGQITGMN